MINFILDAFYKLSCWLGYHHMHNLEESPKAIKGPEGMVVEGEYCCRCHYLDIKHINIDGKKYNNSKIKKIM